MSLAYVTLSETLDDGSETPVPSGVVTFTPTTTAYYSGGPVVMAGVPVTAQIVNGSLLALDGDPVKLLASDNSGLTYEGRTGFLLWTVDLKIGSESDGWMFYLPSSPSSIDLFATAGSGLPGGGVQTVTAGDASIVVGGDADNPAVETGTLDEIAALHPAAAAVTVSGQKVTHLANGSASTDAVAFGQLGTAAFVSTSAFDGAGEASGVLATIAAEIGAASGIASLDGSSHVPAGQLALALLLAGGTMQGFLAPRVATLTDAATVAVNAALGNALDLTLGGNRTVGVPSNPVNGQHLTFRVRQPASGGPWTVTWASGTGGYSFGSGSAPTLSTAASACDLVAFTYDSVKQQWDYLGSGTGF